MPKRTRPLPTKEQEILQAIAGALENDDPAGRRIAINNAFVFAFGDPTARRAQVLREYAEAMMLPCLAHADDKALTYHELVSVFLASALFVQADRVMGKGGPRENG